MKSKDKKFNILVLIEDSNKKRFSELTKDWEKYFDLKVEFDTPKNVAKHTKDSIDILFIEETKTSHFKWEFYDLFQRTNTHFKYIAMKESYEEMDYKIIKNSADAIVYYDQGKNAEWNLIAILRRYWRTYSKPTTVIYQGIVADFIDNNVLVETEDIDLTKKEMKLLKLFMNNIGEYMPKKEIFKKVWGFDEDTSRTLDQMIFKLKKKIGTKYFHASRSEGFKFE